MRYLTALALTVAFFLAAFAISADAHTRTDLDEWKTGWEETATADGITFQGLAEYLDLMARHPWYVRPEGVVYRGMGADVEAWRPLVAVWFPADQVDRALCVMRWESGGNPDAKNRTSSARGLFQILASLWAPHYGISYDALYNPQLNVRLAADIWTRHGWGAWTAWNRGRCP